MGAKTFEWVRRMGVHEAYHLSRPNRIVHWICIPLELMAVLRLMQHADAGRIDLGMIAIAVVGVIYLAADVIAGTFMVAALGWLYIMGKLILTTGSVVGDAVLTVALFVGAFVVQTRVGHGKYERGIDDTAQNVAELRRTGNPIPILLVFFYHLVELMFALGYRPDLREAMESARRAEMMRICRKQ